MNRLFKSTAAVFTLGLATVVPSFAKAADRGHNDRNDHRDTREVRTVHTDARVNQNNLDPNIVPLGLTAAEKNALVAFLMAFTDERVRYEKAPFDHPGLCVSNGAMLNNHTAVADPTAPGKATQVTKCIPPVGRLGLAVPDKNFLNTPPVPPPPWPAH